MHRSFQIFRAAGIPVKVHWTFVLTPLFIWYISVFYQLTLKQTLWVTIAFIAMFTFILFHEFGHAIVARMFDVQTSDILILPIGGLARLERLPSKAIQELWIALAGPAVNLLISLLCIPYLIFVTAPRISEFEFLTPEMILANFDFLPPFVFAMNLGLAAFNLIPAFPMDGGRMVRSLLAIKMGRYKATQIASFTGQIIAVFLFVVGITSWRLSYVFIASFIFIAAHRERLWIKRQRLLKAKISDIFAKTEITIETSKQPHLTGPTLPDFRSLLSSWDENSEAKEYHTIDYHSTLEDAFLKFEETKTPDLLVVEGGQALGLISLNQIEAWMKNTVSKFYF